MGRPTPKLSAAAVAALVKYSFPGNIRELRNLVERSLIESRGGEIQPEHLKLSSYETDLRPSGLPSTTIPSEPSRQPAMNLADAELTLIREALAKADGNVSEAARLLGVDRGKIYRRLATARDSTTS